MQLIMYVSVKLINDLHELQTNTIFQQNNNKLLEIYVSLNVTGLNSK